ncbi:hypothetical protein PIIN_10699 [Serendipita indica DSM 11827]|uniref:Hydrophobin n=1 Tax=Serendipita indica (strain DSM 11827) TaxID=1109443 RepID=G4TZG8_SERID|nr:hypothetical protein PIIN_10699 [Serendipita indica DSM 11827]
MFSCRFSSLFVLVVVGVVVGGGVQASSLAPGLVERTSHIKSASSGNVNSCNVGEAQCCQTIYQSHDQRVQSLGALLGVVIPMDGLMAGVQCSPITNILPILGGTSTCRAQPVCCTGNEYYGLINIGCSPISL